MKAFRFDRHGGPEVLRYEDVPLPEPGPGEVRVRHTAVALNFRDILVRRGQHAVKSFPSGLGTESAGVVEAVGEGVTDLAAGDLVATVCRPDCAYAEARIAPAARVVKLPDGIDERTAASMMVRGMTARYLLRATYAVKPGDTIVIHAAAGGVGMIVSQWAKYLGATVIGTVGSDDKAGLARAHGCDHVLRYNDFAEHVREITKGKGVPVVYDSIGKTTFENSLKCLAPRGILASFGESSGDPPLVSTRKLGNMGSLFVTHPSLIDYTATRADLLETVNDLFSMVASGKVRIDITQSYPLRDAAQAHRDVEARKTTGSVVLIP
ncbi:MAG: quinone oxidoreductase [Alphaproteobacteria bacterium]|nr:quinone oxidoreductase [Alphaproteobacteria bacterium]